MAIAFGFAPTRSWCFSDANSFVPATSWLASWASPSLRREQDVRSKGGCCVAWILPAGGLRLSRRAGNSPSCRGARCWMARPVRSEEHTSELQSLMRISYAVFCLKKKIKNLQPQYKTYTVRTTSHHLDNSS